MTLRSALLVTTSPIINSFCLLAITLASRHCCARPPSQPSSSWGQVRLDSNRENRESMFYLFTDIAGQSLWVRSLAQIDVRTFSGNPLAKVLKLTPLSYWGQEPFPSTDVLLTSWLLKTTIIVLEHRSISRIKYTAYALSQIESNTQSHAQFTFSCDCT